MPSPTTSSASTPALSFQTRTESSFSSRCSPGSVPYASRIFTAPKASSEGVEGDDVLADLDLVRVLQLLLRNRLAVDQRAVGGAEVDDEPLLAPALEAGVV